MIFQKLKNRIMLREWLNDFFKRAVADGNAAHGQGKSAVKYLRNMVTISYILGDFK